MAQKRNSFSDGVRNLDLMTARCMALVESTNSAIAHTQERVRRGAASVKRVRERGMGCATIVLRESEVPPSLVDGEIFDDADSIEQLNQVAASCSCCSSSRRPLSALVRFAALDVEMALCGDCFQNLSDLSLGQVV